MITEKEALELYDRAMGHAALIEKYSLYVQQTNEPEIRDILIRHQQALKQHHNTLVSFLRAQQIRRTEPIFPVNLPQF